MIYFKAKLILAISWEYFWLLKEWPVDIFSDIWAAEFGYGE